LLGWKIDIKSEEEKRQEVEQQMNTLVGGTSTSLDQIGPDLGEGVVEKLAAAGVSTVESLADMTPEELEAIPGIDAETIEKISIAVNSYFSTLEAAEPAAFVEPAADVEFASDPLLASEEVGEAAPPEEPSAPEGEAKATEEPTGGPDSGPENS
jgi:N utilization substance protein A